MGGRMRGGAGRGVPAPHADRVESSPGLDSRPRLAAPRLEAAGGDERLDRHIGGQPGI